MVEEVAVEVTHVFGVKVVQGLVINLALFKGVFHFLNVCENLFAEENVLPFGHIERVDQTKNVLLFLHVGSGTKRSLVLFSTVYHFFFFDGRYGDVDGKSLRQAANIILVGLQSYVQRLTLKEIQKFSGAFLFCDGKAVVLPSAKERVAAVGSCQVIEGFIKVKGIGLVLCIFLRGSGSACLLMVLSWWLLWCVSE